MHLSEGLRFVARAGLIYKTKIPLISCQRVANKAFKRGSSFYSSSRPYLQNEDPTDFASVDSLTKHLSEGLRFVVRAGLIYKTKTPLISCQLVANIAFKRGSSFCSSSRSYLQNEDPIDFVSFGV